METVKIEVLKSKVDSLKQLSTMSTESLAMLAELSKKPNIEASLKKNFNTIKMFI